MAAAANAAWPVVNGPVPGEATVEQRHSGGVVKSNDIKYLTERAAISSETTRACAARASDSDQRFFTIIISASLPLSTGRIIAASM